MTSQLRLKHHSRLLCPSSHRPFNLHSSPPTPTRTCSVTPAMASPAGIPGFYYDAAKGRYFRLLPSHAAPTASFYTASSVQKQQQEGQRIGQQRQKGSRRLKQTSILDQNPFTRCTLIRELGTATMFELEESRRRVYALGLRHNRLWDVGAIGKITAFTSDAVMVRNERAVVVGTSGGSVMSAPAVNDGDGGLKCNRSCVKAIYHFTSQVTSVCLSPQRMLLASCLGGQSSPSIYRTRLPDPGLDGSFISGQYLTFSHTVRSIWTSAASPHNGDVVIGTSTGVICIGGPNDMESHHILTGSDVFAVEFLPSEPSVFVCGSRDGAMRVFDVRVRQEQAPANLTVRHESTITHIRHLNNVTVIINGLQKCALYDLRFPHPASPSKAFAEPTEPVMTYSGVNDRKGYMIGLGFDVCKVRKVMAVANEDQYVRLFSTESGELLESGLSAKEFNHPCRGLKFGGEEREGGIVAIDGPHLEHYLT